jgi:hypothetical protein
VRGKIMSHCKDCSKKLGGNGAVRCWSCENIRRWKDKTYKERTSKSISRTVKQQYINGRKPGNYIDGRTLKKYYCKRCGCLIDMITGVYGTQQCVKCAHSRPIHTKESKAILKIKFTGKNNPMYGKTIVPKYKEQYYKGVWMRSSWEVQYAKYLDAKNIEWKYEFKTFDLDTTTYTPDFYLPKFNKFIEVKGWMSPTFKNKFKRFTEKFPHINLKIVNEQNFIFQ